MRAQLPKERLVVGGDSLPDHRNSQTPHRRRLWADCSIETIRILVRGFAEGIELMRRPQVSRQLLHELRRRTDPVECLELRRYGDSCERLEPFFELRHGK